MNKSSATSLIRDEIVKKNNINAEKRYEIQQAADQVRKSNDMLKEHYLLKRQEQASLIKGALQQLPMLSRKLNDIMARDWKKKKSTNHDSGCIFVLPLLRLFAQLVRIATVIGLASDAEPFAALPTVGIVFHKSVECNRNSSSSSNSSSISSAMGII
ncbi:GH10781 [Drosophila grimshawi]|uniref:GH10781 n=1 Tax=Drosophila grimshawi TaxID=7222 RepID=B4JBA3_DROGR|nr:GH10781 [Drosophila grimshawi]